MTFEDVLSDIEKLIGLELKSINSKANIRIESIDREEKRILLFSFSTNKKRSRPLGELQKVWRGLISSAAVHVDSALGGSGSSRNQPETIFANLPYIEWFKYKRRKHIRLVSPASHDYGTLKEVDPILAVTLKDKLKQEEERPINFVPSQVIIVSGDLTAHARSLEKVSGVSPKPVESGVYEFCLPNCHLLLAAESTVKGHLHTGTYLVLDSQPVDLPGVKVTIGSESYLVHGDNGLMTMFKL